MRLAVLEPSINGLTDDEKKWMPSTIQSSITGDFSDEDFVRIGHLINARYILVGSVTKTATAYMLELSVTDLETGERKASYPPTPVSPLNLENLTAVKAATASLLQQLGGQNFSSAYIKNNRKAGLYNYNFGSWSYKPR